MSTKVKTPEKTQELKTPEKTQDKLTPEQKTEITLGKHAGERVNAYMEMNWKEIPKFTDGQESQDAKGAMIIACHIVANAEKYKLLKVPLLDKDGNQCSLKGKKLTTFAIPLKLLYDIVARYATDVSMFHGANALTSGMYRISLPDYSMNSEDGSRNTYAKGGIFFAKSKKISLKGGYYFTLPQLSQTGWYKKNAPSQPELKDACERLAKRLSGSKSEAKKK